MKKQLAALWLVVFTVALLNPVSLYPADIGGIWKAEFDTQIGVQKYTFEFQKTDSALTGSATSDIGGEIQKVQLTEIKLDSNAVSFVEVLPFQGMELRITYQGIISENEMKLTRNVGDFAAEELVARREEKTESAPE
jgi:hypothetical protein